METTSRTIKHRAMGQVKEFLVIALYLWLVFSLLIVYKSVILAQNHITFGFHGFAAINALALGKIMLVAKDLHLGEGFEDAPLIYPTLLKSALYSVVLAGFKILEEVGVGFYRGKSLAESIAELPGGSLRGLLVLTLLMFVMLIPLVGFGELQRVLGKGKLKQLFVGPRSLPDQSKLEAA